MQENDLRSSQLWMKPIVACLALVLLGCCSANAQSGSGCKVAIINMQAAIIGTKDGQLSSRQLDAKIQPKQKEFDQRQNEIAQLQDELAKGGNVLGPERREAIGQDVQRRKKKLERDISDAQDEVTVEQQKLLQSLGQKMIALVSKYARENHFTVVLDDSSRATPVLFGSVDITQEMIIQYDAAESSSGNAPTQIKPGAPH